MAMNTDLAMQAASASKVQSLADQAQGLITKLQGDVDATHAIWQGQGHSAFMVGSADIHGQLQKGQLAMQEVSMKVGKTGTGYGHADESNASSLGHSGL